MVSTAYIQFQIHKICQER